MDTENISEKNWLFAFLLCVFFGGFGFHRFYVGKIGTGLVYLFTFGFWGIGWVVDMIKLIMGTFKDKQRKNLNIKFSFN